MNKINAMLSDFKYSIYITEVFDFEIFKCNGCATP